MAIRRFFAAACLSSVCALAQAGTDANSASTEAAASLHERIVTLDAHIDIPDNLYQSHLRGGMQVNLPKMREGGLDAGAFVVYARQGPLTAKGYNQAYAVAIDKLTAIENQARNNPDTIKLATSPDALMAAVNAGYLVSVIGLENAYSLGRELEHLPQFHRRGVSYISLTHVGDNDFAQSSSPGVMSPADPIEGLSARGKALIRQLNQLGIMVDVSHASKRSVLDAVALSKAPVIASHSAVQALCDHPRNLSDEELRAIARSGGVIQIVAYDEFLTQMAPEKKARRDAIIAEAVQRWRNGEEQTQAQMIQLRTDLAALDASWPRATVVDLVDHIVYAVTLVGIDHVGLASDFGGGGGLDGWNDVSESANVTRELLRRGFNAADIGKLWSGNYLRTWQAVLDSGQTEHIAGQHHSR